MRVLKTTVFGLVTALCMVSDSSASSIHWTQNKNEPICIAVGTMSSVVDSATSVLMEKKDRDPSSIRRLYSTGELELTEYLWGDWDLLSIPVMWYKGSVFDPPVPDLGLGDSAQRRFEEGDQRIWVIWASRAGPESLFHGYYGFQGYSMTEYDQMLLDIERVFVGEE
jgi:hypothetical protein